MTATATAEPSSPTMSVAERIAAFQKGKGGSSTHKPSAAAIRPPTTTMPKKNNALADRVATFQNNVKQQPESSPYPNSITVKTKPSLPIHNTTDDDCRDGRTTDEEKRCDFACSTPEPSCRSVSAVSAGVDDSNIFPTDAIPSCETQINDMGFPSSSAEPSDATTPSSVLTPTWKISSLSNLNKTAVSGHKLKFSAAILTQSPQVITERGCDGDELETVEVAVIMPDDVDEEMNSLKGTDNSAKQKKKSCNDSNAELPVFTYTIPLKGEMPNKAFTSKETKHPDTKAADGSISFDSLRAEYLNSTWNLSFENSPESFSSEDLFVVQTGEDVKLNETESEEQSISETDENKSSSFEEEKHPVTTATDVKISFVRIRSECLVSKTIKEDTEDETNDKATESMAQRRNPGLVSRANAVLLARRAAQQKKIQETEEEPKLQERPRDENKNLRILLERNCKPANLQSENLASPTGVDGFGTEEEAELKFHYLGTDNDLVISAITAITPDTAEEVEIPRNKWTCQSDFSMIFGDDLLDEQEKPVKAPSTDFFGADRIITKSISSKEALALIEAFESSLGVLADKVADGYDLVASGLKVKLGSGVTTA